MAGAAGRKYLFLLRTLPPLLAGSFFVLFLSFLIDRENLGTWRCGTPPDRACFAEHWVRSPQPAAQTKKKGAAAEATQVQDAAKFGGDTRIETVPPIYKHLATPIAAVPPAEETAARFLWGTCFSIAVIAAASMIAYCTNILLRQAEGLPFGRLLPAALVGLALAGTAVETALDLFGNPIYEALINPALRFVTASGLARALGIGPTAYDALDTIRPLYSFVVILTVLSIVVAAASLTTEVPGLRTVAGRRDHAVLDADAQPPFGRAGALDAPGPLGQVVPKALPAVLVPPSREIAVRMATLSYLLYGASATLVLAVIAVRSLVTWPTSLARGALQADMSLLGNAALVHWGAGMSVLLVMTYGSVAFWLERQADKIPTAEIESDRTEQKKRYGLALDAKSHAGKILVSSLPLLTGGWDQIIAGLKATL